MIIEDNLIKEFKKLLDDKNTRETVEFHSKFNNACDQVLSWKAYVEKNKNEVLRKIEVLKTPLRTNPVYFKYVLAIGRSNEKIESERKRNMFAQKNSDDFRVLTYDGLISDYINNPKYREKIILSHWRHAYRIKSVPRNIRTHIFSDLTPEDLLVEDNIKTELI